MLFFNNENQEEIYLNNLPKGRIYNKAYEENSNFNKVVKWIASQFKWLVDRYNLYFKGLFICKSDFFIEEFKKDYSIPSKVFYPTTKDEHRADIKVKKYLMWGNRKFNFEAIAYQYGICAIVKSGVEYFKNSRIPNSIPHRLYSDFGNTNNILVITLLAQDVDLLPHSVPHRLNAGLRINKIKSIFEQIKPAHIKILYLGAESEIKTTITEDRIPSNIPHTLGSIIETEIVYNTDYECKDKKICTGD